MTEADFECLIGIIIVEAIIIWYQYSKLKRAKLKESGRKSEGDSYDENFPYS